MRSLGINLVLFVAEIVAGIVAGSLALLADAGHMLVDAVAVHIVLEPGAEGGRVLDRLDDCLADHFDVEHSTFQLEPATHQEHERPMHT